MELSVSRLKQGLLHYGTNEEVGCHSELRMSGGITQFSSAGARSIQGLQRLPETDRDLCKESSSVGKGLADGALH